MSPDSSLLFDRAQPKHAWLPPLADLAQSSAFGHHALAENWRMDGRVDEARQEALQQTSLFPPATAGAFQQAITGYFNQHQCRPVTGAPVPGYWHGANDGNLVPLNQRPARKHLLLHMVSINALLGYLANRHGGSFSADFQLSVQRIVGRLSVFNASPAGIKLLVARLQSLGPEAIKRFAGVLSHALGPSEPLWWAAFAHEIGKLPDGDWSRAAAMCGLGHLRSGDYLLAWRYSPEIVGRLYRPTVAEARDSGFHFPVPPSRSYGITMPLQPRLMMVREMIHAPLKGAAATEACTGDIGSISSALLPEMEAAQLPHWLTERRREHALALQKQLPADEGTAWLTRHGVLP